MPLSEQEQRLLDEMERHLLQNDADVVSAPSGNHTLNYRNITIGALLVLVGLGALVVGVATQLIVVGIIGFVVMLVGVVLAIKPSRVEHVVPLGPPQRGLTPPFPSICKGHSARSGPFLLSGAGCRGCCPRRRVQGRARRSGLNSPQPSTRTIVVFSRLNARPTQSIRNASYFCG